MIGVKRMIPYTSDDIWYIFSFTKHIDVFFCLSGWIELGIKIWGTKMRTTSDTSIIPSFQSKPCRISKNSPSDKRKQQNIPEPSKGVVELLSVFILCTQLHNYNCLEIRKTHKSLEVFDCLCDILRRRIQCSIILVRCIYQCQRIYHACFTCKFEGDAVGNSTIQRYHLRCCPWIAPTLTPTKASAMAVVVFCKQKKINKILQWFKICSLFFPVLHDS